MELTSRVGAHMLASMKARLPLLSGHADRRNYREAVKAQAAGHPGVVARGIRSPVEDHPGAAIGREKPAKLLVYLVLVAGHDHQPARGSATAGLPEGETHRGRSLGDDGPYLRAIQRYHVRSLPAELARSGRDARRATHAPGPSRPGLSPSRPPRPPQSRRRKGAL